MHGSAGANLNPICLIDRRRARMPPVSARLRRIADRAGAGAPLGADGAWLADGIDRYLAKAREGWSLDDALSISPTSTGEAWWAKEDRERCHDQIRQLHRAFCPGSVSQAAGEIARLIRRYASSSWKFDQGRSVCPERYAGTPNAILFEAFKAMQGAVPGGERQLRRILSGGNDDQNAGQPLRVPMSRQGG
jgi:hypothetical protein